VLHPSHSPDQHRHSGSESILEAKSAEVALGQQRLPRCEVLRDRQAGLLDLVADLLHRFAESAFLAILEHHLKVSHGIPVRLVQKRDQLGRQSVLRVRIHERREELGQLRLVRLEQLARDLLRLVASILQLLAEVLTELRCQLVDLALQHHDVGACLDGRRCGGPVFQQLLDGNHAVLVGNASQKRGRLRRLEGDRREDTDGTAVDDHDPGRAGRSDEFVNRHRV
jgi:hypothetical protein